VLDHGVAAAATPPAQAPRAGASQRMPPQAVTAPDEPAAPAVPAVKLTPELIESLRNEPLIKALMDQMGAQIVKVE